MSQPEHSYQAHLIWDGNRGAGTAEYEGYGREYRVVIAGKPDLTGSADPTFRGDPSRHNPEDLFVTAISSCHMLSYLALCARRHIRVLGYEDAAVGTMRLDANGGGRFEAVVLHPLVTVASPEDVEPARELHERAHQLCFIANSCRVPIRHEATVRVAGEAGS